MGISITDVNETTALSSANKASSNKSTSKNEIEDTFELSDSYNKVAEIAQKYDVTNMSEEENSQMMSELVKNGSIELKSILSTTLGYSNLAQRLYEQGYSTDGKITVEGVTYSKDDTTRNYIDDLQQQIKYRQENHRDTAGLEKLLNFYQTVDYFHNNSEQAA